MPVHVCQPQRPLPLAGLCDHGRGEVDAGDVSGNLCDRTGDEAGATSDIQHWVTGADFRRLDDQAIVIRNASSDLLNYSDVALVSPTGYPFTGSDVMIP